MKKYKYLIEICMFLFGFHFECCKKWIDVLWVMGKNTVFHHMIKCPSLLVIKNRQIKTTQKYYYTPIKVVLNSVLTSLGKNTFMRNYILAWCLWRSVWWLLSRAIKVLICFGQIIAATRKYLFLNVKDVYKKSILKYRKIKTHIYGY